MTSTTLDRLADGFYAAAFDDTAWPTALAALKTATGGHAAMVCVCDERTGAVDEIYGDCGPQFAAMAMDPAFRNPFLPAIEESPTPAVFTNHALMPRQVYERSLFYNEWARPQGLNCLSVAALLREGNVISYMNLSTERPDFGDDDLALLEALVPTLGRVAQLRARFGVQRLTSRAELLGHAGVGAAVVDGTGRILLHNERAQLLFADDATGVTARRGMLRFAGREEQARLERLLGLAAGATDASIGMGGEMAVRRVGEAVPALLVSVSPVRNALLQGLPTGRAAMVLLRPVSPQLPEAFEARATALFDLTPREAALAGLLASGSTLQAAAAARAISINTARTQLAQMFRKTGTTQQSQLVALLLGTILPGGR